MSSLTTGKIAIVGTGYVADLYMRSLKTFPSIVVTRAHDIDGSRLTTFCNYWKVPAADRLDALFENGPDVPDLILNLTNPEAHFAISEACLRAGKHVYSEKPLALNMPEALALRDAAERQGLLLASAPCSPLCEAAQTLWLALRRNEIGKARLVYAELDDDFISQAAYKIWASESGAPWPYVDEFRIGCTIEHAGYSLTWLMAMFGPVRKVVAASARLMEDILDCSALTGHDYSTAILFFDSGVVARLTCSILAPRNHRIQIIGDRGILEVGDCWNNSSPVRVRRRFRLGHRLITIPFGKQIRISGQTHPKVNRRGAPAMNFALGPAEMLEAIKGDRTCRLSADFALHVTEVTLAIQNSRDSPGQKMTTSFKQMDPMPWAKDCRA